MEPRVDRRRSPCDLAAQVRGFYDRYPYPPPAGSLEKYRQRWQHDTRRSAEYHRLWPARSMLERQSILIAGCGTSQAAKHALRWPSAEVVGIDVSETSLRHTRQLQQQHGLANLRVDALPLERVGELGISFDQIVCTGVLHHLPDPDAGLAALRSVLKSHGAMHLMLYAPYGRTGIYMLQEFCKRLDIHAGDQELGDLVEALRRLPPGHPLERLLRFAPDFRQPSALADALLHPHDRAYSVAQLFTFIERAGLTFGRWLRQAPYSARCGVMAQIPYAARLRELGIAEQSAAAELFRGTIASHSFIAYRNDGAPGEHEIRFDGDDWLHYVPIHLPDTIAVKQHLPPRAAAVLINQGHVDTDLVLPITAAEARVFEAIDGERPVGDIIARAGSAADVEAVRDFFERLWWHDHVVFAMPRP